MPVTREVFPLLVMFGAPPTCTRPVVATAIFRVW